MALVMMQYSDTHCGKSSKISKPAPTIKMSDADERSKEAKRREYNRNAQRMFRQRRKERLQTLERAERERISSQSEEIEHLRQENLELRQENEALTRFSSAGSSPSMLSVTCPPHAGYQGLSTLMTTADSVQSVYAGSLFPERPLAGAALTPRCSVDSVSGRSDRFCIVAPYDIHRMRNYLRNLFHPVLSLTTVDGTFPDPQLHSLTLARLAPSLPPSLQPTPLQLQTPHNPQIDLIPSPSLRDMLLRSDIATAATFLREVCTFACEIEDRGQVTVWGEEFLNEISWEFSAPVLERWSGWLLPSIWRERADFWRRQRGEQLLF